ncbi:hypothetical protein [Sediminibacter sp. Hel_I_10]|uniref:hypothetical protein n=1 Tax=Sediminibacter sp. Hel_I_10 TaxID=1392490 RepID=UPI00047DBF30|nr:hypothetical protein [Sediminibacter sp. Hel_I_10]
MLKVPLTILVSIFTILLITLFGFAVFILIQNDLNRDAFKWLNQFYINFTLCAFFLGSVFNQSKKNKLKCIKSPWLTLCMLIGGVLMFGFFILKLIEFGLSNSGKVLFWQLSIALMAICSIGLFVKLHVGLINSKN